MKIDRHNYEEFFLLYVDNELNVDQKKEVETFVLANPDLEEEFIMLQQSKLVADDSIVFDGKESLMKETSSVNMSNYEEWLLLYTDNELTAEQRSLVENFAAAHPHVKEELDLFLQAKLEPQEIVFADKASLYRREEKVAVIKMTWWRVAAAAIFILAAGFGTYSIINKNKTSSATDVAQGTTPAVVKPNEQKPKQDITKSVVEPSQLANETREPNKALAVKENQNIITNKKETPSNKNLVNEDALANNNDQKTIIANNTTASLNTTESSTTGTDRTNAASSLALNTPTQGLPQQTINNPGVTKTASGTPDYEKANDSKFDDETASNSENKKLRGFFRKATRFIERTTKMNPANDDDKLLIGSVAVSLK